MTSCSDSYSHDEVVDDGEFVGDGGFVGEGDRCLQLLWESYPWTKMRVHCPGRYFIPGGVGSGLSPAGVVQALALTDEEKGAVLKGLVRFEKEGKDPIVAVFFPKGGGLLTYAKVDPPSFVHTFNTRSGLERKLQAMGLAWSKNEDGSIQQCS